MKSSKNGFFLLLFIMSCCDAAVVYYSCLCAQVQLLRIFNHITFDIQFTFGTNPSKINEE